MLIYSIFNLYKLKLKLFFVCPYYFFQAIFAVLREGLSLSQAARKYDIPYPTFVLYANRVHNMLGPSADGVSGTGKY